MKIVVLHHHGICPHCNVDSCIYVDFDTDEDGTKMCVGYICDSCQTQITKTEFRGIEKIDRECHKGEVKI
jgi:hypothetical protein